MADAESQAASDAIRDQAAAARQPGEKTDDKKTDDDASKVTTTDPDIEAIIAKAENPDAVRNALVAEREAARAERKRADELAAKVRTFEDRDKSEQEKLEERATTAENRATQSEAKLLRFEVATSKRLPVELADRLQGETKKDLEADADRLLELVKPSGKPAGDIDAGKGEGGGGGNSFNDLLRVSARR